jgi:membrane protease YdiL (CAAX protease family)
VNKLTNWIKRHQVLVFFILAFAITWPAFILVYFVFPRDPLIKVFVGGPLGVFGPALAAMLISAIVDPQPRHPSSKPRWIAFGVSWLFSWLIMTLYYWRVEKMELVPASIVWVIFALLPAWILSSAFAKTPGIRKQFSTLLRPKGKLLWYLVALLIVPVVVLLGVGITRLLGGEVQNGPLQILVEGLKPGQSAIILALFYLSGFLCAGGINEESGWRGFALPRLQKRYPVLIAIGVVWIFWALWHIPLYVGLKMPVNWIILTCTATIFPDAVFLAWVYNRTKGSILAPALLHPSSNTSLNFFPVLPITAILFISLAVFIIVFERMWKKLPSDHPAVYQAPGIDEKNVEMFHQ